MNRNPRLSPSDETVSLHEGAHIHLVRTGRWEYATRPNITGIVYIIAITDEEEVILTEQHRIPVGGKVIELPAGLAGDVTGQETEALELAARRELLEETGYEADRFERLTAGPPSSGITSEVVTLFRARGLRQVGPGGGDANEDITVHKVPLTRVREWLAERQREGFLVDPKIFAGLYFVGTAAEVNERPT